MGNRLTQIATRTGDDGTTGLADNTRLSKADARIEAIGQVDELNAHLGLLASWLQTIPVSERLSVQQKHQWQAALGQIQHDLFQLGSELCLPGYVGLSDASVIRLDDTLAECNAQLPRLVEFILPGGSMVASQAHVCRTVARRVERHLVGLPDGVLGFAAKQYINRLSDLLFVWARQANHVMGVQDVYWQSAKLAEHTSTDEC